MAKKKEEEKDRKVYTFTLHLEDDKELVDFLKKRGVTKNVKKGLELLMSEQKREERLEAIDKEQLLLIISLLTQKQGSQVDLSQLLSNSNEEASTIEENELENSQKENSITKEEENEYQKIKNKVAIPGITI
ncbi:hypothetical protein ABEW33_27310 [Priestia megaterium]